MTVLNIDMRKRKQQRRLFNLDEIDRHSVEIELTRRNLLKFMQIG